MQNMAFQKDRMNDMLMQAEELAKMIAIMQHMYGLMKQLVATTHHMVGITHEMQDYHLRIARPPCGFRRLLQAAPQLLLLGKALLRHSRLLLAEIHLRWHRRR